MSSIELILAVVGAADLCLQYGKKLTATFKDFKNANENIKAKFLIVEAIWSRTAVQVEFVKRVASTFEEEHCRIHLEVFEMLKSTLIIAATKIESVIKSAPESGVKKWKYLFIRESIDETISELKHWQHIFDPTWYLILRIGDRVIDTELSKRVDSDDSTLMPESRSSSLTLVSAQRLRGMVKGSSTASVHVSLPEDGLDWESARPIRYSSTQIIQRTGSTKVYVVDTIVCNPSIDVSATRVDAEALAKKLSQVDPDTFGLLVCHGVVKRKRKESRQLASISLAFRMPAENQQPTSLRWLLMQRPEFSLNRVLDIARQLAQAVSFIHTCDFVHKNIRPETVLVFPDQTVTPPSALGSAYLLGFDSFRSVNFNTMQSGDGAWERNLYRHPSRQGFRAQERYIMQHDVYSLGVCLLELGLWVSFVHFEGDDGKTLDGGRVPSASLGLEIEDVEFGTSKSKMASTTIKDYLVDMAKSKLPMRMGGKYTAVVVTCLTCLDENNDDFGDEEEMRDDDGILIGVRFIEKVLCKLNEISF